jgi:hypothetical protein
MIGHSTEKSGHSRRFVKEVGAIENPQNGKSL